jgi:hypothetical protein
VDWHQLLDGPLLELIRAGDLERARMAIRDTIGV